MKNIKIKDRKQLERLAIIIEKFSLKNFTIALAESCTGGFISHMLTNISGASKVFERGIVSYSNQAKIELLSIDPFLIENYGAVSQQVAEKMAYNIRNQSKVHIGIGITGIAGPTGGTPDKPVGLVFIGFSTEKKAEVKKLIFNNDRIGFKRDVLNEIIDYLENLV